MCVLYTPGGVAGKQAPPRPHRPGFYTSIVTGKTLLFMLAIVRNLSKNIHSARFGIFFGLIWSVWQNGKVRIIKEKTNKFLFPL